MDIICKVLSNIIDIFALYVSFSYIYIYFLYSYMIIAVHWALYLNISILYILLGLFLLSLFVDLYLLYHKSEYTPHISVGI